MQFDNKDRRKYDEPIARQISAIPEDQLILRASYGPSARDKSHTHSVGGRTIYRTNLKHAELNATYRFVQFADTGQEAWVNEANIRSVQL